MIIDKSIIVNIIEIGIISILSLPVSAQKQSIDLDEMHVEWNFEGNALSVIVTAPAKGWIAVGFNDINELTGTNLIMGAAEHGHFKMSDRFIVRPGEHCSVLSLGVDEALSNRNVAHLDGKTIMRFSVQTNPKDKMHKQLFPGKKVFLLLAYSVSTDFDHHSRWRGSIRIEL